MKMTLVAGFVVMTLAAYAQTSRGTVTGTVLDPAGAVVGGARLTITGRATGVRLSTDTNEAGASRFDAIDPGIYDLEATRSGFRRYVAAGVGVHANRTTTIDARFELGASESQVEVKYRVERIADEGQPASRRKLPAPRGQRSAPALFECTLTGADLAGNDGSCGRTIWGGGYTNGGGGSVNVNGGGFSIDGQRPPRQ